MTGTLRALLGEGARRLATIDGPARDARILLAHAAELPRDRLALEMDAPVSPYLRARFLDLVARRARGCPVSRLIGHRAFYGRAFEIGPDVLDPRPETETLVAVALETSAARILDLGTGSGAILITLLAERPGASGLGTDISEGALSVAARNAARHGVSDRATLLRSDWWDAVSGRFDLVVSNPPYIAADEMPGLAPEVRDHDPPLALTPGGDGLGAYRAILGGLRGHLAPGGRIAAEIGPDQGGAVAAMMADAGLHAVAIRPDLDGRDRVVLGRAPQ